MGSVHFADESFYPLRQAISKAFADSQYLVVELDIKKINHSVYTQLLQKKGVYKNGKTIKDAISDETWLQLRQRLQHLNLSYDSVKSYKPGILVLTLTSVQVMQMGFDPELGIDYYFLEKAYADKSKKIIELESLEQQINLFLDIPNGELLLKESLYSLDESELLMSDMMHFWKEGDVPRMNKLLFEDALDDYPAFTEIYDELFYGRNQNMVAQIERMLRTARSDARANEKENYFVVVGSGHLVGDKGIVNALKQKGYTVERK